MGVPKSSSNVYALSYVNNYFLSGHQNAISFPLMLFIDLRTSGGNSFPDIYSFAYGAGKYLYGNQSGQIATSTDTIHWIREQIEKTTTNIRGITYGNSGTLLRDMVPEFQFQPCNTLDNEDCWYAFWCISWRSELFQ